MKDFVKLYHPSVGVIKSRPNLVKDMICEGCVYLSAFNEPDFWRFVEDWWKPIFVEYTEDEDGE